MIRRRVIVRGTVQGVFFRDSCQREAWDAGVAGWVTNTPDGAVEAVFEGETNAVDRMVEWCRQGPPHATVEEMDLTDEPPRGESGFSAR